MVRPRNVNRTKASTEVPDWEQEEFQSRTQIKKAAQAVTDLGEQIAEMSETDIKKLQLPSEFEQAILLLKTMDKGPAIKRQKLFLGKYLRQNEPLIVEIKDKLAEIEARTKQQNAHFQQLEKWRDRMVEEGDDALAEFLQKYPQADRQQLRQWIRNAQKEREGNKPPKSARLIFKYLRGLEW
ncbi:ribosome biogenesis factor YjgA [Thiomicrorhabdus sp. ZW0627]|uniref:ribosome biogenesis factor YjgA n=1 Tax=Thiomicrorhabdus sp. ZW0627 TaxID=3039774 RepID=UPI0024363B7A|nr:ribosome biogenesis factor YjgA [Thiomicrorhabdus sp. ZW0627]MDG6772953.1 ribosome biogenesis factor YjgA [Thiomicrorhabdus sp. ZW0627]